MPQAEIDSLYRAELSSAGSQAASSSAASATDVPTGEETTSLPGMGVSHTAQEAVGGGQGAQPASGQGIRGRGGVDLGITGEDVGSFAGGALGFLAGGPVGSALGSLPCRARHPLG